ncbi:alanine racemase [Paludibacterium paludis]|uniref:Alanine racemase n=1 Tax=Paludibacterium paludis TaxID=1225769 RepID=A0A918P0R9_9NEIS|nr:alanine racemase [Paludibacterium paludis]GGY10837.1 alanine racemase [Paludibacterium paludis]
MRPLLATIRLDRLKHNYLLARRLHGGKAIAAVKANAYGHGAVDCARALSGVADGFAVACLEEAVELRDAGIGEPIVMLEGVFEADELEVVSALDLWPVVQNDEQLAMVLAADAPGLSRIWLKMDSGMHRAGFAPAEYAAKHAQLMASGRVGKIVRMTHFACADEPGLPTTQAQIETFDAACRGLQGEESLANSAAIAVHPRARRDWGRPGIMLYGASPLPEGCPEMSGLQPVMRLTSRVFGVRELPPGEAVGYGATFTTDRPTRVGLVACGYADGYPRIAPCGTPVAVDGLRTRVIGRVSMDMMTIDLTDLPSAGIGSEVELWGDVVGANEVAASAGTLGYEILCNVKRARRIVL